MPKKKMEKIDKRIRVAATMPPLYHKWPNAEFKVERSEVLRWIQNCPELIDYLFDYLSRKEQIIFNKETGRWMGVEHNDTCPHGDDWDDCPDCRH